MDSDIAIDFKEYLEDLKVNSKPEIDTLTLIARENPSHAQAISKVLEEHINKTRAEWKLPALYVLDSLIRHVGPPYSTYLGSNLYNTFMEAYRQVGNSVRRDMEAVLRTWKEPPMGSRDPRPVLPLEITTPIENALLKFKTAVLQSQAKPPLGLSGRPGYRNSPTPQPGPGISPFNPADISQLLGQVNRTATPPFAGRTHTPPVVRSPASHMQHGRHPSQNGTPVNMGNIFSPPKPAPTPQPLLPKLQADVKQLLDTANLVISLNAGSSDTPTLVTTLQGLKSVLETQHIDHASLMAIQAEINKISHRVQGQLASAISKPAPSNVSLPQPISGTISMNLPTNPYAAISTPPAALPFTPPTAHPLPKPPSQSATPLPPQIDVASILSILGPPASAPQPPAPTPQPILPGVGLPGVGMGIPPPSNPTPQPATNSLFDQLRAAGILGATPTPQPTIPGLPFTTPVHTPPVSGKGRYGVRLDQESITKIRRPHLVHNLYDVKPDQCRQCGRRFAKSETGKEAKIKHLDWHFRTNSRVADNTRTAIVHRSPYLDEIQWSQLHESAAEAETDYDPKNSPSSRKADPVESFVPAPTDVGKLNEPCSICMEKFASVWHAKTSQPVWMDAVKIGEKYYHASCWAEVSGANKGMAMRSNRQSPSVLGKRKFAT